MKSNHRQFQFVLAILCFLSTFIEPELLAGHKHCNDQHKRADYVIVGGGSAGAALAQLLSKKYTVILLEAGEIQNQNPLIRDPLNSSTLVSDHFNEFFWQLGNSTSNVPNRVFPAVAGRLVGGGSAVSAMQYVRSTDRFQQDWEDLVDDKAWGPLNALAIYKRLEKFNGVPGFYDPVVHGRRGPFQIRQATANLAAANHFVVSLVNLGYPEIDDYNDPETPIGAFSYWQLTQKRDRNRESSATAFLPGNLRKKGDNFYQSRNKNLSLYTNAKAKRIHFSKNDSRHGEVRAKGVITTWEGKRQVFYANKKVILTAGFISPLILQASGIGEKALLKSLGIPVLVNNANVGSNLISDPIITLQGIGAFPTSPETDPKALYTGGALLHDPSMPADKDRSLELIGFASPNESHPELSTFTISAILLNMSTRGNIHITNRDPTINPTVDFNYFGNEQDILSAIAAYDVMFRTLVGMGLTPVGPNPSDVDAVKAYLSENYNQAYHYSSTCRMSTSVKKGVVSSTGHVFGVKDLIVADICITPFNVKANPLGLALLIPNVIGDKLLRSDSR